MSEPDDSRLSPLQSRAVTSPEQLNERTPAHLVDDLHTAFGQHHDRAVHTKGVALTGTFLPDSGARDLSSAALFNAPVPLIARFSNFTGLPDIADTDPHAQPRGLALKFLLPDGSNYDVVSHSYDGFPVATAADFGEMLLAIAASGPGASSPSALDRFLEAHPTAEAFLTGQTAPPESFATTAYFGVNSFQFTNSTGVASYVRYRFLPEAGEHYLDDAALATKDDDYLMREIALRVTESPVAFRWEVQIADLDDPIEDPSVRWPETRAKKALGTIRLDTAAPSMRLIDRSLLFLPGSTPPGIAIADPMLTIRNAAYPKSFAERSAG